MAAESPARLFLIVTGSTLRAEEVDRPLAYYLKQRVEQALERLELARPFQVLVIADFRWIHDESLHELPTISLGGPGVNALAQNWLEEIPLSLAVDEQYFIQMDAEFEEPRASIWGMDNPTTQIGVAVFIDRFLPRLLDHVATLASDPDELD